MTGPGGAPELAMLAKGETIEQVPGHIAEESAYRTRAFRSHLAVTGPYRS